MYIDFAVVDPLIAGAAIAGVGSLLGGLFGHKSSKSANAANLQAVRETNQANMDLNRYNWAKTYQMWYDTNEYNTPLNQRQRFMQAGINPYFALNSMNAGNAGASSSPSMIPMQAGHVEPYNYDFVSAATQNALQTYFQGKSIQSSTELQKAQANKTNQEARALQIENNINQFLDDHAAELGLWKYKRFEYDTNKSSHDSYNSFWDYMLKKQSWNFNEDTSGARRDAIINSNIESAARSALLTEQVSSQVLETAMNKLRLENLPKELAAQLRESYARAWNSYATGRASLQQASAAMKVATEQVKGLVLQNGISALDFDKKLKSFNSDLNKILWENRSSASDAYQNYRYNQVFSIDKAPNKGLHALGFYWNNVLPFGSLLKTFK